MKRLLYTLLLLPLLSFAQADPETVPVVDIARGIKLVWNSAPTNNVAKHRVSIGPSPGVYTDSRILDGRIPTESEPVVIFVEQPGTYFMVVTAINPVGMESPPSNEVQVRVMDVSTPPAPTISLVEQFNVLAVTQTVTTTRIIKEIRPAQE